MTKSPHDHNTPQKPTLHKRCKYCQIDFTCVDDANGKKRKFCTDAHKKAYFRSGKLPFPRLVERLLKEAEKVLLPKVREIAREEINTSLNAALCHLRESPLVYENLQQMIRAEMNSGEMSSKVNLDLETELEKLSRSRRVKPS